MNYELVLGLEVHLQLNTVKKMFCSCKNDPFGSKPNTNVCPVCLGLPGAMPVPNKEAIEKAYRMAEALGSHVQEELIFQRKNYFYPDLPKAYQITTPHYPVGKGGSYEMLFPVTGKVRKIKWREIHIEEDSAKSHHKEGKTWIDYNKSGVPLLEMVTEAEFRSVDEAVQFAKEIQMTARYVGASEADMEKGHMRLETNISLKKIQRSKDPKIQRELPNYRVEIKNINSFTFMKKAVEAEVKRQSAMMDRGETPDRETRGYDEDAKKTFSMRGKEEAHDYRYFPEPDIPPVRVQGLGSRVQGKQTLLPRDVVEQLRKEKVRESYLPVIVADKKLAEFTLEAIEFGKKEKIAADSIAGEIVNKKIQSNSMKPSILISSLRKSQTSVVSDDSQLQVWVEQAIKENTRAVEDIRGGKMAAIGALIGSVMKYSKGKADAKKVQKLILSALR